jgi:hypothetical protein
MLLMQRAILCAILGLGLGQLLWSQGGRANSVPAGSKVNAPDETQKPLDSRKRFAYEAVRSAVAVPQGELQDRLSVLAAASSVIGPIRPTIAKTYSREGLRVEQELIQRGEQPVTSMLNAGPVDCKAVQTLVESIPVQRVDAADTTLVGAVGACPAVSAGAQRLIDAGLEEQKLAPRATMAMMEHAGLKSAWSQEKFEKLFAALPANASSMQQEAPNIAAMYARSAGAMDPAAAKKAGVQLLLWLGKLDPSGDRTVAVNVTAGSMKQVLGDKEYEDALASDVMARQVAQSAGGEGEISHPVEESISVLKAMQSAQEDRSQQLEAMPPAQRAREAAASGFASGSAGDRKLASHYFDIAFSSLNAMWGGRESERNAQSIVREVCEAAAQVDALDALRRAEQLDDLAAQAIGMIAVARVVASDDREGTTTASQ